MKAVILAGGYGTRLSEETVIKPKPMVEIGGEPILWHIMKLYSHYGINDFIICLGYKGYIIKEFFANYFLHQSDVTIDLKSNQMEVHNNTSEPWKVTLVDTGIDTQTGSRLKKIQKYLDGPFMVTYGDGVADIDINKLLTFHKAHGKIGTMSSTQPEGRFGALEIGDDSRIDKFMEKPKGDGSWINIGFFIFEPEFFSYIGDGNDVILERAPLENLAKDGQLYTYKHEGFWKCMDTIRDKKQLEEMWLTEAKWKIWE